MVFPWLCSLPAFCTSLATHPCHCFQGWNCRSLPFCFCPLDLPPAFLSKCNLSHRAQRVQPTRGGADGPEVWCACLGQPSQQPRKGLAKRSRGHNLRQRKAGLLPKQAGSTWGKGLETSTEPSDSSQQTSCGWRQGLNLVAEECGSFPLRSPNWHCIPTQDVAYIIQLMKAK